MCKHIIFVFSCIFSVSYTFSQTIDFDKLIPSSPNIASLAKYAMTPVSYYTGIPNIDIPIYTIQTGHINVPISLNYHSGGIKVSEESGIVGLGWALNAGGVITRSVAYKDDFDLYLTQPLPVPDPPLNYEGIFDPSAVRTIERGYDCAFPVDGVMTTFPTVPWAAKTPFYDLDWVPDTFFYNFNGYSGSFWLDQDGIVHQSKKTALSIVLVDQTAGEWKITTPTGIQYEFKQLEHTYVVQHAGDGGGYISSWYLTKITAPSGDTVEFSYDTKEPYSPIRSYTQQYNDNLPYPYLNLSGKPVSIHGVYLSEINFKKGKIIFQYSEQHERLDIDNTYFVTSIEIYSLLANDNLVLLKEFDFDYSYFGSGLGGGSPQTGDYYSLVSTMDSDPS